ncbi:UNVERIFIED_CONTAM: hypothetical protein Sindi_0473000, partial [Sesamum indicum]
MAVNSKSLDLRTTLKKMAETCLVRVARKRQVELLWSTTVVRMYRGQSTRRGCDGEGETSVFV